jgi:nifR3 family TIM-barrel protein
VTTVLDQPAPARPVTRTAPLHLGSLVVDPPVVLAPMAGVTNAAFRTLCAESGAGLYVAEMTTARGVAERDPKTLAMLKWSPSETVKSVQLYGVDPVTVAKAVRVLTAGFGVDHVDLNFGCPVPKVTKRGGGAVLPYKRRRYAAIVAAAVAAAEPAGVPVTVKTRLGIDADHLTWSEAGRIAQEAGAAAIALHGRTAAQHYSGEADWGPIGELAAQLDIPVLGNGDIWDAADALRMLEQTGAAGVVVGRGCLGRPWLFRDLAAALTGRPIPAPPRLDRVLVILRRHAELLCRLLGEDRGCADLRKHIAWYLKGFSVPGDIRLALGLVWSLKRLDELLARIDTDQDFPDAGLGPRGRQGSPRPVSLPEHWLDDPDSFDENDALLLAGAELAISGG